MNQSPAGFQFSLRVQIIKKTKTKVSKDNHETKIISINIRKKTKQNKITKLRNIMTQIL